MSTVSEVEYLPSNTLKRKDVETPFKRLVKEHIILPIYDEKSNKLRIIDPTGKRIGTQTGTYQHRERYPHLIKLPLHLLSTQYIQQRKFWFVVNDELHMIVRGQPPQAAHFLRAKSEPLTARSQSSEPHNCNDNDIHLVHDHHEDADSPINNIGAVHMQHDKDKDEYDMEAPPAMFMHDTLEFSQLPSLNGLGSPIAKAVNHNNTSSTLGSPSPNIDNNFAAYQHISHLLEIPKCTVLSKQTQSKSFFFDTLESVRNKLHRNPDSRSKTNRYSNSGYMDRDRVLNSQPSARHIAPVGSSADTAAPLRSVEVCDFSRSPRPRKISVDLEGNHGFRQFTISAGRDERCCRCMQVFHPYSGPRMIWDLAIIALILYTAIAVPLRLAWSLDETLSIWILDRLLDLVFMVDIAINFNTAFQRGTELVIDRKSICTHYVRSWFFLDFVASFPFDLLIALCNGNGDDLLYDGDSDSSDSSLSLLPRLVRLFKLSRLFRLARLQRILRRVQLQLGIRNSTNKILKFSGAAVLCAHWMACAFYATSTISSGSLDGSKFKFMSWVDRLEHDANGQHQLDASNVAHTYIASLYWSLTTMTSIGYGDVSPKTPSERVFGIFGMICGAVLFGHFMGNVLAAVANMSPADNEFQLKMDQLNAYMRAQNLPAELRRQIEEFYHIEHKLNSYQVDEAQVLRELPDRLKRELSLAISRRILGNVPLFEGMSSSFVRAVGLSMQRRVYPQGEYVIREGQENNQFYIVTAGRAYLMQSDMVIGVLQNGDYFGSIPIHWKQFAGSKATYSVRTLEWTEVRSLSIARFRSLINEFPSAKDALIQRIVDNILQQNQHQIDTVTPPMDLLTDRDSNACDNIRKQHTASSSHSSSSSSSLNRKILTKYVKQALYLDDSPNAMTAEKVRISSGMAIGERNGSMIFELKKENKDNPSILKDLKQFEIDKHEFTAKESKMKQQIIEAQLSDFDGLIAMLSLMVNNNNESIRSSNKRKKKHNKNQPEQAQSHDLGSNVVDFGEAESSWNSAEQQQQEIWNYIKRINDNQLLQKMSKLRKVIQYFTTVTANATDTDSQMEIGAQIDQNMNAFFRPYIVMEPAQDLKSKPSNAPSSNSSQRSKRQHGMNRLLYHYHGEKQHFETSDGLSHTHSLHLETLESMFFKLGYKPTFHSSASSDDCRLDTTISQNLFDIVLIDSDDIHVLNQTLSRINSAICRNAMQVLFVVTNHTDFHALQKMANTFSVHAILRKPLLFQDVHALLKSIGVLVLSD